MNCKHNNFQHPEAVWKSRSKIVGRLGQISPILPSELQTFPAYMPQKKNEIEHPLSFVTKEECKNCNFSILKAYESIFYKDEIIFELIKTKEVKARARKTTSNHQSVKYGNSPRALILRSPIVLNPTNQVFGSNRDRYNFHDEPQQIKDAVFELVKSLFSVEGFLSEAQANVVTKLKLGRKLRKSTERNTKKQLQNKFRTLEYIVHYWEDLEDL